MIEYHITNKEERSGCIYVRDLWAAYRGKYPDPTPREYRLISYFLYKYAFEDDHFVEEESPSWISLKNRLGYPNLRHLLIKLYRQIRESKGYDVDLYIDLTSDARTLFVPRSLDDEKSMNEAMAATKFAIREINARMGDQTYELVSVDKLVSTMDKLVSTTLLLLTFTAKEIVASGPSAVVETFQAMLNVCEQPPSTFQLLEWKFKP